MGQLSSVHYKYISSFFEFLPVLGVKIKKGYCVFWLFFTVGSYSAESFKKSRRELSIIVADPRSTWKIRE